MTDDKIIMALALLEILVCETDAQRQTVCDALDLINRQKAEIERLNKEVDRLSECVLYHDGHIVDAIKEFVAEIEAELAGYELHFIEMQDWSARNTIRQVISAIKEMVGESNG